MHCVAKLTVEWNKVALIKIGNHNYPLLLSNKHSMFRAVDAVSKACTNELSCRCAG